MRIAHINALTFGSTGGIMLHAADLARTRGHTVFTYSPYPYSAKYAPLPEPPQGHRYFGTWLERRMHNLIGRVIGWDGSFSKKGTEELVRQLREDKIELVHLHNLHGYCIHLPTLFRYIKQDHIKVVWTLHDCWSFTGHCAHYEVVGCDKWKTACRNCPQIREYPQCRFDNSKRQHRKKKEWFSDVEDMTLVLPSHWLQKQVKQSFLKGYPTKVINNGIDLTVFQKSDSDFRKRYHCEDKKLVLGVAFGWGMRKGLDVFIELAKRLDDSYQIVLVGTSEAVDATLPDNILSIHRTADQKELAAIYTAADVFVNPTREEVLGLVNIEALACGTPVVTFNSGGSPECVDETCGVVVEKDDTQAVLEHIVRICEQRPYNEEACIHMAKTFDKNRKFTEYVDLYEKSRNHHSLLSQ